MSFQRIVLTTALCVSLFVAALSAHAQITINELVVDQRTADSSATPDVREFIELYNAGASAVDISGWSVGVVDLGTGIPGVLDALPGGSTIPAGGYFVIGAPGVPNVNFSPVTSEIWPDANVVFELRNPSNTLVDAVALETFRGVELTNASQEQLDQIAAGQTAGPAATGGWWGQDISGDAIAPNVPTSVGRYLNGRDTNRNGYDFGVQPVTPGASNNLPQAASHTVPNVDALSVGSALGSQYYASFVLPRVIDPTAQTVINNKAIPASPQGGKAIVAWDETGGGNAVYSKELVNKFELYAYIDTSALNVTTSETAPQSEATVYGIGTTDPFFGTPNSAGLLTGLAGGNITSSSNGSTGLGWMIQRREFRVGTTNTTNTVLQLVDMNDGGDGVLADADWTPIQTLDLTGVAAGWHRLSIDYNPTTGTVVAKYDDQTFNFNTATGLAANFYAGYRENLPSTGSAGRPATFDLYLAPASVPGDYNGDGSVTSADYTTWKNAFGTNVTPGTGADGNNNGVVDAADYAFWRDRFSGAGFASAAAVPEPAAILLAACGLAFVPPRRRR